MSEGTSGLFGVVREILVVFVLSSRIADRWMFPSCKDMSPTDVSLGSSTTCGSGKVGSCGLCFSSWRVFTEARVMLIISGLELTVLEVVFFGFDLEELFVLVVMRIAICLC